jgi:hypothetical protein
MVTDGVPSQAAYIFSPDASYGLVSKLRDSGLPTGVHFVASVTGPWQIVAIAEFDDLSELPAIVESVFGSEGGGEGGGSVDPETAYTTTLNAVKRSVYADEMAFVRIDLTGVKSQGDLDAARKEIEEAIGSAEFNMVFGDFDVFACVAADDADQIQTKILQLRGADHIAGTTTLWIIEYVSA